MKIFRFLNPDPAEGNTPDPGPSQPDPTPAPATTPAAAPPPAAEVVLNAEVTEEKVRLEKTLRDREMRIAQLEDENRTLKTIPKPTPVPVTAIDKRSALEKFMEGED